MKITNVMGVAILCLMAATAGAATIPSIQNTSIETRTATAGLEPVIRELVGKQSQPAWIGYAVPIHSGWRVCCSSRRSDGRCRLEREEGVSHETDRPDSLDLTVKRNLLVLFRVNQGEVQRLRYYSDDCELDAGGLPFFWLTDVVPQQSITWLASFVIGASARFSGDEDAGDRVVGAIAMHDDPAAFDMLVRLVEPGCPESLRKEAAFWIGDTGGRQGVEALKRMLRDDPSRDVRDEAVFALTLDPEPDALETLIDIARNDKDPEIRSNAIFWLGNEAGERAAASIADMAVEDPDTDVKEKAVFALSQMSPNEGVPRLIQIARTNPNPEIRKQAIFWLGQSYDSRALDFFEEILTH